MTDLNLKKYKVNEMVEKLKDAYGATTEVIDFREHILKAIEIMEQTNEFTAQISVNDKPFKVLAVIDPKAIFNT